MLHKNLLAPLHITQAHEIAGLGLLPNTLFDWLFLFDKLINVFQHIHYILPRFPGEISFPAHRRYVTMADTEQDDISITEGMGKTEYYHGMLPRVDIEPLLKEDGDFILRKTEVNGKLSFSLHYVRIVTKFNPCKIFGFKKSGILKVLVPGVSLIPA